jgi:hypothetical protein
MKTINIADKEDLKIIINLEDNVVISGTRVNPNYGIENTLIDDLESLLNRLESYDRKPLGNRKYITNNKIISTYEDIIEHFTPAENKYFVTGITSSKFDIIDRYFKKEDFFNVEFTNIQKKLAGDENSNAIELNPDIDKLYTLRINKKLKLPILEVTAMILSENKFNFPEYVLYLDTENPIKYVDFGNGLSTFTYLRSNNETYDENSMVLFENFIDEPKITSEVFIDRGINTVFEKIKKLKTVKNLNELTKTGLGYYKINRKGFNFNRI